MSQITLYNYYRSSTSYRVRIALHYKNIEFKYHPVHLLNNGGEQHQESYKKLNPMEEVPTLDHKGIHLAQSMAILEYLEEFFPNPSLLPKDIHQRAKIRQFCENINSFLHPLSNLKVLQYLEKKHNYTAQEKEEWIQHWYAKGLSALETSLKQTAKNCSFGDSFTFADCFLVPLVFTCQRFNVDLKPYPILLQVNENCQQFDFIKKSHPLTQIDTPENDKRSL